MLSAILAADQDWGIGKAGDLPWPKNSADLKWFREMTERQMVIMGRGTWDSPMPAPLPNRMNVLITSQPVTGEQPDRTFTMEEFRAEVAELKPYKKRFVIGGAKLFHSLLDIVDEIYISRIADVYDCDTFLDRERILSEFELTMLDHPELNLEHYKRK